jgi:hypothetical protein
MDVYALRCPRCGRVEGHAASEVDEEADHAPPDADELIEQREFDSAHGPVTKYRCPRCGTWVDADRVQPA